jgi:hypothetical protein
MAETRSTFVLRLWREAGAPAGEWRGEVLHLQAERTARFADAPALFAFVRAQMATAEDEGRGEESR